MFISCTMKHVSVLLLLTAAIALMSHASHAHGFKALSSSSSAAAIGVICDKTQELCNSQCFDPLTQKCVNGPGGQLVCKIDEALCNNWECYSPETDVCIPGRVSSESEPALLCRVGQQRCGSWNCYRPETAKGHDEKFICDLGHEVCGGKCFDPKRKTCISDRNADGSLWQKVCDIDQELCGVNCFTPSPERRCTKTGAVCGPGEEEEGCGLAACFNPSAGEKCYFESTVCRAGEQLCGGVCYNPERQTCLGKEGVENDRLCDLGSELCGTNCIWPENTTCHTEQKGYGPWACPKNLAACGYECYDRVAQKCIDYGSQGLKTVCPIGQVTCGDGPFCYDPNSRAQICIGSTVCARGQSACGNKCYHRGHGREHTSLVCHRSEWGPVLCPRGQLPCQCKCYDPATQNCHKVPLLSFAAPLQCDWF